MKITAKQAVTTTAKLNKVGKQLTLIGNNLMRGKYASKDDLLKVRASVVNAYNIARRANDQMLDCVNSCDDLKEIVSSENVEVFDDTIEASLNVATKSAMLCQAIDGELEELEPVEAEEEIDDVIEDDEVAETEASEETEEEPEVEDDEILDDEPEEVAETEASKETDEEDEIEDDMEETEEEEEEPEVVAKKAAVAVKKASLVKKNVSKAGISWNMPSLPECKRR